MNIFFVFCSTYRQFSYICIVKRKQNETKVTKKRKINLKNPKKMKNEMQVKKTSKGRLVIQGSKLTLFDQLGGGTIEGSVNSKEEIIARNTFQHHLLSKAYQEATKG